MAVPTYAVPSANSDTATEEPKIITALAELKAILNGGLEDDNFASGSDLALSRLDAGTGGQLVVCNASGVPQYRTISGNGFTFTVSNTGVITIADFDPSMLTDGTAGQVPIATGSAGAVYRTLSGDVTIDANGVVSIGTDKVGQHEIGELPAVRVYRNTEQSIGGSSTMSFTEERFDFSLASMHDASSDTKLTAPFTGVYFISATVGADRVDEGDDFKVALRRNGSEYIAGQTNRQGTTETAFGGITALNEALALCTVSTMYRLTVGDYVEVFIEERIGGGAVGFVGEFSMAWHSEGPP